MGEVHRTQRDVARVLEVGKLEITKILFFNPDTGSFQDGPPTFNAATGKYPGLRVYFKNNTLSSIRLRGVVSFLQPGGIEVVATTGYVTVDPGYEMYFNFYDNSGSYVQGTYNANIYLQQDTTTIAYIEGVTVAYVSTPPVGVITNVVFWNPTTGSWESTAPTVVVGQRAGVGGYATNPAPYALQYTMGLGIIAPDGTTTSVDGKPLIIGGGQTAYWLFETFVCSQVGTYRATLILYAAALG